MMFSFVFATFPYGVLGQVGYLIVSIPDRCLIPFFDGRYLVAHGPTFHQVERVDSDQTTDLETDLNIFCTQMFRRGTYAHILTPTKTPHSLSLISLRLYILKQ